MIPQIQCHLFIKSLNLNFLIYNLVFNLVVHNGVVFKVIVIPSVFYN